MSTFSSVVCNCAFGSVKQLFSNLKGQVSHYVTRPLRQSLSIGPGPSKKGWQGTEIRGNQARWLVGWLVVSFIVWLAEVVFGCCVIKLLPHKHTNKSRVNQKITCKKCNTVINYFSLFELIIWLFCDILLTKILKVPHGVFDLCCYETFFCVGPHFLCTRTWDTLYGFLPMVSHYYTDLQGMIICSKEEVCLFINMDVNNARFKLLRKIIFGSVFWRKEMH